MASSASSSTDEVLLTREGNKGIITLNREKALNALNLPMIKSIYPQLRKWETDNDMKMVIIKGAGEKAFCSGGDVKAIAAAGQGSPLGEEFFRAEYRFEQPDRQPVDPIHCSH